jgi:hypothetical protein
MHRIVLLLTLVGSVFSGAAVQAAILDWTDTVIWIAPPADSRKGYLESDTRIRAWVEKENLLLTQPIEVDITEPGTVPWQGSGNLSPDIIPAGTIIDSYFFHFDQVGAPDSPALISATITSQHEILGIMIRGSTLNEHDAYLGVPGTIYATGNANRGLERSQNGGIDSIIFGEDRRTIHLMLQNVDRTDELRIITAVPEPAGWVLGALGFAMMAGLRGWRRVGEATNRLTGLGRKVGRVCLRPVGLILLVLLAGQTPVRAAFVMEHQGSESPGDEGFVWFDGLINPADPAGYIMSEGPVINDGGFDAWNLDVTAAALFGYTSGPFSAEQVANIENHGVTLELVARALTISPESPVPVAFASLAWGAYRYDLALGVNPDGTKYAALVTSLEVDANGELTGTALSFPLLGGADYYHSLIMYIDPVTKLASVGADGIFQIADYAGNQSPPVVPGVEGLYFGVLDGGSANFSTVRLTSVPEPETWVLGVMGALVLMGVGWRRRTRDSQGSSIVTAAKIFLAGLIARTSIRFSAIHFVALIALAAAPSQSFAAIVGFGNFSDFTINKNDAGAPISVTIGPGIASAITLTDTGDDENRSIFSKTSQQINGFTATFTYQARDIAFAFNTIPGAAFVLHQDPRGASAVGSGGRVGYAGISPSIAVVIGLENQGNPRTLTTVGQNGSIPAAANVAPVNAYLGNPIDVRLVYDGTLLTQSLTDSITGHTWSNHYFLGSSMSDILGSSTAYVGFTANTTGGAYQTISNFTFTPVPEPGTWVLMGMGALVVGITSLRRVRGKAGTLPSITDAGRHGGTH